MGIDEAGRGPIAGPVVVAAVVTSYEVLDEFEEKILDSKSLSPKKRKEIFEKIFDDKRVMKKVAVLGNEIIDKINILEAVKLGAIKLIKAFSNLHINKILIDGNVGVLNAIPVVKGDKKEKIIGLASIVAKEVRDRIMLFWDKQYPFFDFARHKGYPTKKHKQLLKKYKVVDIYRRTYKTVKEQIGLFK